MQISALMKAAEAPLTAWLAVDTGTAVYKISLAQLRYGSNEFYYVSDGNLFTTNWQSDEGDNYVLAPAGTRIVSMYNGTGKQYIICIGDAPFTVTSYKSGASGPVVELEFQSQSHQYNGTTYYYTSCSWSDPAPFVSILSNAYADVSEVLQNAFSAAFNGLLIRN